MTSDSRVRGRQLEMMDLIYKKKKKKKKKVFIASELFMHFSQTQVLPRGARNSRNNLATRKQLSPAVVEGGPR